MKYFLVLAVVLASPCNAKGQLFNCDLDLPQDVRDFEKPASISTIKLFNTDKTNWKFKLSVDSKTATVDWPESPMQLDGKGILIQTGSEAYATFIASEGPCLFTEGHCGSMVQFAKQKDKSLSLLLQPIALIKLDDGRREPYKVFLNGRCQPLKATK